MKGSKYMEQMKNTFLAVALRISSSWTATFFSSVILCICSVSSISRTLTPSIEADNSKLLPDKTANQQSVTHDILSEFQTWLWYKGFASTTASSHEFNFNPPKPSAIVLANFKVNRIIVTSTDLICSKRLSQCIVAFSIYLFPRHRSTANYRYPNAISTTDSELFYMIAVEVGGKL